MSMEQPDRAGDLMQDAIRYTSALAPRLSTHLRDPLVIAMAGPSAFARLPMVAEVLYAAREDLGTGGRDLLIRIAKWGEVLGQQTLRNGRGEAIAFAILRDRAAGEVVPDASDPPVDPRMIPPPPPEPEPEFEIGLETAAQFQSGEAQPS